MTTILDKAATDKLITSIKGRGAKLDADIHQAAVSALSHHDAHGDITLINRLVTVMPKSGRKNALVAWALHFDAKLALNTDKASRDASPLVHVKADKGFDFEGADAKAFWDFKAQEGTPVFAFDTFMASLEKSINKGLSNVTDEAQKARLQAVLAALNPAESE